MEICLSAFKWNAFHSGVSILLYFFFVSYFIKKQFINKVNTNHHHHHYIYTDFFWGASLARALLHKYTIYKILYMQKLIVFVYCCKVPIFQSTILVESFSSLYRPCYVYMLYILLQFEALEFFFVKDWGWMAI